VAGFWVEIHRHRLLPPRCLVWSHVAPELHDAGPPQRALNMPLSIRRRPYRSSIPANVPQNANVPCSPWISTQASWVSMVSRSCSWPWVSPGG